MPVPKRKRSRARRDSRFANKFIAPQIFATCGNAACGEKLLPHRACGVCGFYKGRKVLATKNDRGVKRTETRKKHAHPEVEAQGAAE